MDNNKGYLKQFGLIFIITSVVAAGLIWLSKQQDYSDYTKTFSLVRILLQVSPVALMLAGIGIATGHWKAAAGSFLLHLLGQAIQFYIVDNNQKLIENPGTWMAIQLALYIIPMMLFFLFAGVKAAKLPFVMVCTLLLFGTNGIYQMRSGFSWLGNLFNTDWKAPEYIISFLVILISQLVHILLFCELLNYASGKNDGFQRRIINPGNEYDKLNATIVFWTLKTFILMSVLGSLGLLKEYVESSYNNYGSGRFSYLKWYYLISLLATTILLMATAWYLRKFLLEYFFANGFSSRFLYWFLLLPVLGFFGWLGMLPESKNQASFAQRKKTLDEFAVAGTNGIVTVFLILLGLRFLLSLSAGMGAILVILVSAGLFFMLISSVTGYYVNLYLNLLIVGVFLLLPLVKSDVNEAFVLFPLLVLNVVQLILIHPALHFGSFNYISYEEDKPWQPGDDLF